MCWDSFRKNRLSERKEEKLNDNLGFILVMMMFD